MLLKLDGSGPLHVQLYRELRAAILAGRLPPGARLPSTRALAAEAGVSRNTVYVAYDQLLGEGYAAGRPGSGTYVSAELPDETTTVARHDERAVSRDGRPAARLSRLGKRIRDWDVSWAAPPSRLPYDFRYGRPAFTDFPHATWRRLLARRVRAVSAGDLDYGPPAGLPALREAIAGYLGRARGVVCTPEQVVVVSGSQQGLDLAVRVLLDAGDRVLVEEPGYTGARGVFVAAGAEVIAGPVDAEGLSVEALPRGSPRVRLAYVTPSHQFPTGVVMPLARRLALLAWAERVDASVIEDDYDSEFRYAGRPVESLQGLDRTGRVIYLGTFSKLLFPALRLGYLVPPAPLVRTFVAAKGLADTGSATLEQLVLADFIREGHFERHIRRLRARNAARRAAALEAIAEQLGDRVEVTGANAGLHLLVWLNGVQPDRTDELIRGAAEVGVGVYSPAPFYRSRPGRAGLLLGYASLGEREIRTGIRRLATVL